MTMRILIVQLLLQSSIISSTVAWSVCGSAVYMSSKTTTALHAKQKRALLESIIDDSVLPVSDSIEAAFQEQEESGEGNVIRGFTDEDFIGNMDEGSGGVQLAMDSCIVVSGNFVSGVPTPSGLSRYSSIRDSSSDRNDSNTAVLASGYYYNAEDDVFDVASQAAVLALKSMSTTTSAATSSSVCVIVAGGDGLLLQDSLQAVNVVQDGLSNANKLEFYSVSGAEFGDGAAASVTVLSRSSSSNEEKKVFEFNGKWYELVEDDLVTVTE